MEHTNEGDWRASVQRKIVDTAGSPAMSDAWWRQTLDIVAAERRAAEEKERSEWLAGKRCHICGGPKEQNLLTDTCGKCFEEE